MSLRADIDHVALDCKNQDNMVSFYTATLDFAPYRIEEFKAGKAPFPSVRLSDATILDFFQSESGGGLARANHMCFNIPKDSFPALKSRLEGAGISVPDPKLRSGARGDGWSVYVRDPEENLLEFRWYD